MGGIISIENIGVKERLNSAVGSSSRKRRNKGAKVRIGGKDELEGRAREMRTGNVGEG